MRQSTELAIGVAFRMLQALLGPDWRPRRVCFAHDAPADRSVHERVFGRHVEFGHDFNGIVCARADLEVPNPDADPVDGAARAPDAGRELREQEAGHDHQVRELVVMLLGTGTCTIDRVAAAPGHRPAHDPPPPRPAKDRRFLRSSTPCGASSRSVTSRTASRSLAEVSSLLGFSAPSGFSRWYRQRFKAKPSEQRSSRCVEMNRRNTKSISILLMRSGHRSRGELRRLARGWGYVMRYRASESGTLNSDVEPAALVAVAVKNAAVLPSWRGLPFGATKLKVAFPAALVVTVVVPTYASPSPRPAAFNA